MFKATVRIIMTEIETEKRSDSLKELEQEEVGNRHGVPPVLSDEEVDPVVTPKTCKPDVPRSKIPFYES